MFSIIVVFISHQTEVVWPNMKSKFSFYTTLSNTKGWVSVSGPRASGKSLRVLSTCHSLLANSKVLILHHILINIPQTVNASVIPVSASFTSTLSHVQPFHVVVFLTFLSPHSLPLFLLCLLLFLCFLPHFPLFLILTLVLIGQGLCLDRFFRGRK